MFIAEPRDRKPAKAGSELEEHRAARLDRERREFIRAAAMAYTGQHDQAWAFAVARWNARPEDC